MEINIRLYRVHDEDLFAIYQSIGGKQMGLYIKDALTALVRHEMPRLKFPNIEASDLTSEKRSVRLHLSISDKMFREESELIGKVAPAYRQVFIKSLLRVYHFNELLTLYGVAGYNVDISSLNMNNMNVLTSLLNSMAATKPVDKEEGAKVPDDTKLIKKRTKKQQEPKEHVEDKENEEALIKQQSEADMDALADMFGLI